MILRILIGIVAVAAATIATIELLIFLRWFCTQGC